MQGLPFKMLTRRNRIPLALLALATPAAYQRVDLPQVGYAAAMYVNVSGNIASGAGAVGTWATPYWPFNLLSQIKVTSNEGLEVYRTGGYGNQLVQKVSRFFREPATLAVGTGLTTTGASVNSYFPTGAMTASTTYYFSVNYRIPLAVDKSLAAGLLLLQNQATRASLEVTAGQFADFGFTTSTNAVLTATVTPLMEFYSVPADPAAQPDTTFIHRWIQDEMSYTATGDQVYKVPVNGIISRVIVNIVNNSIPYVFFTTANRPDLIALGNMQVGYAGSQVPEVIQPRNFLAMMRESYGTDMPDGVLVHEFSEGGGDIALGWDGRDTYNTAQLTEFAITTNLTTAPTGTAKLQYIREELQARAA